MKILHLNSYYISSTIYKHFLYHIDRESIFNEVYIPVNSENMINKNRGIESDRINYIYSRCFGKLDRIIFHLKNYRIEKDLYKKVDFKDVGIVHAHSLFVNGYLALKLKRKLGLDYMVAVRATDVKVFFKKMIMLRKLGVDIMKNAKYIIFISPYYKDNVIKEYIPLEYRQEIKEKSIVIPNGIDKYWFENINMKTREFKDKKINLIYAGRLEKVKNIDMIVNVVEELIKRGYDIKLDMIGKGKEENKIKKLSEGKFKNIINLYDYMPKEELIKFYRKNDIFIMPSKRETFGLVYIEAITQGLPVIYTKNEGIYGYFEEGQVGYGVDCKNVHDIADKVEEIYNRKIWDMKKFEEKIKIEFNWDNIVEEYIKYYKSF
ncbi:glycosyltransferase family 4 protein [Peptacetobacter sp.]|uniref:glycosyltransferase family 4 protein n=1 Tax=Peptacetobacter sp. TaxID=2991975 RepID=UPI00260B7BA1|nr:glycosyltransferase family 4 protein [Peptacetobacter sp.]